MFELLPNPKFNFMARRTSYLVFSSILVIASIGIIAVKGLELGIEFSGGTELQTRFASTPDLEAIRKVVTGMGLPNPTVTTLGDPSDNDVLIRLSSEAGAGREDRDLLAGKVRDAIRAQLYNVQGDDRPDLNIIDSTRIAALLNGVDNSTALADAIYEMRKDKGILASIDDLNEVAGMSPAALDQLRQNSVVGPLAIRKQSFVFPSVGRELMTKARLAIVGSLIGMLLYIWVRFQFQWGLAAVVALAHDAIITLGLFALFERELSLAVVAAFLTLVGYSVNDTVVVFDRIRENLKTKQGTVLEKVNRSINQTLTRTIITSGLTFIAVLVIYIFGGEGLKPFAFVLSIGVIVGTYSSICVATPFLMLWQDKMEAWKQRSAGRAG